MATTNTTNLIACLESCFSPTYVYTTPPTDPSQPTLHLLQPTTVMKLRNLTAGRVKDMRTLGQSKQIISHIPITAPPQLCAKHNDAIHTAIVMNGERLAALAMLPTDGKETAKELARCVGKYKFVGGVLGLSRDVRLDDGSFWALWDTAEKYRVPVCLREMWPLGSEVCPISHFRQGKKSEEDED
jgi:predicted TIM-barrel fold metal-dependent hydrolase